jgi:hypothetical protein
MVDQIEGRGKRSLGVHTQDDGESIVDEYLGIDLSMVHQQCNSGTPFGVVDTVSSFYVRIYRVRELTIRR